MLLESGIGASEEVFTLCLQGRIGSLALVTAYPAEYSSILGDAGTKEDFGLINLGQSEFGFDHNQLTQAMLADWGMPQVFQEVVLHHETLNQTSLVEGTPETVVTHFRQRLF